MVKGLSVKSQMFVLPGACTARDTPLIKRTKNKNDEICCFPLLYLT
jgi:hypothetical protein